jgi:hypothetical protein
MRRSLVTHERRSRIRRGRHASSEQRQAYPYDTKPYDDQATAYALQSHLLNRSFPSKTSERHTRDETDKAQDEHDGAPRTIF